MAGLFRWESLALLRNVSILRIGYAGVIVVPAISYGIVIWNGAYPEATVTLPLPLLVAFVASCFLAVGHLLNEVFTPKLIKIYGSLQRYEQVLAEIVKNRDVIYRASEATTRLVTTKRLRETFGDAPAEVLDDLSRAIAGEVSVLQRTPEKGEATLATYEDDWNAANIKALPLRITILVCYVAASVLTAWLTYLQLGRVISAAYPP